jgi:hypothetical protein
MMRAHVAIGVGVGGLLGLGLGGCRIDEYDLTGKQCPCVSGWICDQATNTCQREPTMIDAPSGTDGTTDIDAFDPDALPADAGVDGAPSVSCLGDAFGASLYADALDSLTGWTTVGDGTWASAGSEAVQSLATALDAYAYPTAVASLTDYRVALRGRKTGGVGTILASFRIQVGTNNRYRCSWKPQDGSHKLEAPRPQGDYRSFAETQAAVGSIPGYDPAAIFTIEVEAVGNSVRCCVREVPAALIQSSNTLYSAGPPGIETVTASGAFDDIQVNAP